MTKYTKGSSGNPAGRPKGTTTSTKIRKLIESQSNEIIDAVIESAKQGDMTAARILIDRICPTLKPQDMPVKLPGLIGTLSEQGAAIIKAMSTGSLTPSEAQTLLTALTNQSKIIEIDELTKRVEALESNAEK